MPKGGQGRTEPDIKSGAAGQKTDRSGHGRTEGGQVRTRPDKTGFIFGKDRDVHWAKRFATKAPAVSGYVRPCPPSIVVHLQGVPTHDTLEGWLRTEDEEKSDLEA